MSPFSICRPSFTSNSTFLRKNFLSLISCKWLPDTVSNTKRRQLCYKPSQARRDSYTKCIEKVVIFLWVKWPVLAGIPPENLTLMFFSPLIYSATWQCKQRNKYINHKKKNPIMFGQKNPGRSLGFFVCFLGGRWGRVVKVLNSPWMRSGCWTEDKIYHKIVSTNWPEKLVICKLWHYEIKLVWWTS